MDDHEYLLQQIPQFAGYEDESCRRLASEQVRARLGVALSRLHERLASAFDEKLSTRYDDLLLRCQFVNQEAFANFEHAELDAEEMARQLAADRQLLEIALRIDEVDANNVASYLNAVDKALSDRDAVMENEAGRVASTSVRQSRAL